MKLSFSTRGWWQEGWDELVATAEEMGFEVLGDGMSFAQAYSQEKCNIAAVADLLV